MERMATTTLEPGNWTHELKRRASSLWILKMLATMGGIAIFFYAYFWVMRHPLSAMTVMPVTWIDDLVPFFPQSFLLYVTLWVYVALAPALAKDGWELASWGAVSLAMAVVGLGIFMVLPTKIPNTSVDWLRHPPLAFLKTVDVAGNACPSLHAAFIAYMGMLAWRMFGRMAPKQTIGVAVTSPHPPAADRGSGHDRLHTPVDTAVSGFRFLRGRLAAAR